VVRVPSALRQILEEIDAEVRAKLDRYRQKLPAWIGVYVYPNETHGERTSIKWCSRDSIPRGEAVPTVDGHKPRFTVIIDDVDRLDSAARYAMRYWVVEERRQLAVRRKNRGAERAASGLLRWLRSHPPSLDQGARNVARANAKRDAIRTAEWRRWQSEANAIWKDRRNLSKRAVAELVKRRLQLSEHADSIARRIRRK
jgi:hypothetical protein